MTESLLIKRAKVIGRQDVVDIKIENGLISEIGANLKDGAEVIDAGGRIVSPGFMDMHFHLDSVLTMGDPRYNESGTLLEGIEIWAERKRKLSVSDIVQRAGKALRLMVAHGTTAIRTHADVTDPTLTTVKGLLEVKKLYQNIIDVQITAFPQDGILTDPANLELLEKAVEMGVDNVGMIPHIEYTREDGVKSIEEAFRIAKTYDRDIDGHVDETDDEQSRFLEVVASYAIKENYVGRVAAGHCTAMHSYNDAYAAKLYRLLKKAGVTVVANPLINIHLQGRFDTYPKRRGMARVKELLNNGVNVALGHDCIMDPWYPLGRGDMVQVLFMAVHVGQLMSYSELKQAFNLITYNAAKTLRIGDKYGIKVGAQADLVVLDAFDELEALAFQRTPLYVIKRGRIVSKNTPEETQVLNPENNQFTNPRKEQPILRR
ncbi:MAG: cytosine deaminase [Candidatus Caldarchaeum sp.]|nr:cytosine deaminase [Candidatus Caldarchaeum sp.]